METLLVLNRYRILDSLFFGGGTMLRLCHNLNRYSTDLDFWINPGTDNALLFDKIHTALSKSFSITDAEQKRNTLLFEIKADMSTRRLVLEIRKDQSDFRWERKIAFSKFSIHQITVKGLTLEQMMQNKVNAFCSRKLIRDCYDIHFLITRGVKLPVGEKSLQEMLMIMNDFKDRDFNVTLGSVLDKEERAFFKENRFQLLREEILSLLKTKAS